MNEIEIENRLKILLSLSEDELEIENPKVDFKKKWYDLKDEFDKYEFMKDVTSIANTTGKDGLIIIGYDEKAKTFHPAKRDDCGLSDSSHIQNLVLKMCSDVFTLNTFDLKINGNEMSVIHIPPVFRKPILLRYYKKKMKSGIKEEEQRIFVRKNTRTHYANKNDIDLMYFEREYLKPEYEYEINLLEYKKSSQRSSADMKTWSTYNSIDLVFDIENLGRRNLSIRSARLIIRDSSMNKLEFKAARLNIAGSRRKWKSLIETIKPEESKLINIHFGEKLSQSSFKKVNITEFTLELTLSNGMKLLKRTNEVKEKNEA